MLFRMLLYSRQGGTRSFLVILFLIPRVHSIGPLTEDVSDKIPHVTHFDVQVFNLSAKNRQRLLEHIMDVRRYDEDPMTTQTNWHDQVTYLRLLLFLLPLQYLSLYAILLDVVAVCQVVFVWSWNSIALTISSITIDTLYCVESCAIRTRMTRCNSTSIHRKNMLVSRIHWLFVMSRVVISITLRCVSMLHMTVGLKIWL